MAKLKTEFKILVAGPSDVPRHRKAVFLELDRWNRLHSEQTGVLMRGVDWLMARPELAGDPQQSINSQDVDDCDAVVAVFGTRPGTRTPRSDSGTVEEIERLADAGKDVMVYFSRENVPVEKIDPDELKRLRDFQESMRSRGLLGYYKSLTDLKVQLETHITSLGYEFERRLLTGANPPSPAPADHPSSDQGPSQMVPAATADLLAELRAANEIARRAAEDQAKERREAKQAILEILPGDRTAGPWIYMMSNPNRADVKYQLRNRGRAPARNISARVVVGDVAPVMISGPKHLPPDQTAPREGFVLSMPEPFPGAPDSPVPETYSPSSLIRIKFSYTDDQRDSVPKRRQRGAFSLLARTRGQGGYRGTSTRARLHRSL